MTDDSTIAKPERQVTFSLSQMLIFIALLAIPLTCFRMYWTWVNDTVDESTVPFENASEFAKMCLWAAGASSLAICLGALSRMLIQRRFNLAIAFVVALGLCLVVGYPLFEAKILRPVGRNPKAYVHNDAAAIAAVAIANHYERTGKWPRSWNELTVDIEEANTEMGSKSYLDRLPPTSNRLNILLGIDCEELSKLVDVDFEADANKLSKQKWHEFQGIRPHKPSYNFYRNEFRLLIDCLQNDRSQ